MATHVLTDVVATFGGVDLSDHISQIAVSYSAAEQPDTHMGDTFVGRIGGLKDWSVSVTFSQDYAASEVNATLFPLVGTSLAFVGRPTSAVVSATNPQFSGSAILTDYTPMGGSVGDKHTTSISLPGNGTLTMATST